MRLAIFGATGRTGRHLFEQALAAGHEVKILVRDLSKVKVQSALLKVLVGNVQNAVQVEQAVAGSECVISVLGPTENKPTHAISAGTDNILTAMKKQGVHRLIVSTGVGVGDPDDAPAPFNLFMNFLLKIVSRYVYEDMLQTAAKVRASDLDWTIVRVPMITDGPQTGKIQAGYVGKGMGARISRADMADFILKQVNDNTYLHKAPAISN